MTNINIITHNPLIPLKDKSMNTVHYAIRITKELLNSGFFENYHPDISIEFNNNLYIKQGDTFSRAFVEDYIVYVGTHWEVLDEETLSQDYSISNKISHVVKSNEHPYRFYNQKENLSYTNDWMLGGSVGLSLMGLIPPRQGDIDIIIHEDDYKKLSDPDYNAIYNANTWEKLKNLGFTFIDPIEGSGDETQQRAEVTVEDVSVDLCLISQPNKGYNNYYLPMIVDGAKVEILVSNPIYTLEAKMKYLYNYAFNTIDPSVSTIKRYKKHKLDVETILELGYKKMTNGI